MTPSESEVAVNVYQSSLCRTITLNTEDGNFSVSMLLYKDEAFEDRWTTVPSLTLDDNIFVKVFMVNHQDKVHFNGSFYTLLRFVWDLSK